LGNATNKRILQKHQFIDIQSAELRRDDKKLLTPWLALWAGLGNH